MAPPKLLLALYATLALHPERVEAKRTASEAASAVSEDAEPESIPADVNRAAVEVKKEGQQTVAPSIPTEPLTPPPPSTQEISSPAAPLTTMILLEGYGSYGGLTEAQGDVDESGNPSTESSTLAQVGARATLGVMPDGSMFTIAGRLRGGSYIGRKKPLANLGIELLFGANFLRSTNGKTFVYALGGAGIEFIPAKNQDLLTLHASGGAVVKGLSFGADIYLGANDEFAVGMLGLTIGWGRNR